MLDTAALSPINAQARCKEYDKRRQEIMFMCLAYNTVAGFAANVISDNTTKQKVIGNGIGSIFALSANVLLKRTLQGYNEDYYYMGVKGPMYIEHEPATHLAVATSGYILGGVAGFLVHAAANKTYSGIKGTWNSIFSTTDTEDNSTEKKQNKNDGK